MKCNNPKCATPKKNHMMLFPHPDHEVVCKQCFDEYQKTASKVAVIEKPVKRRAMSQTEVNSARFEAIKALVEGSDRKWFYPCEIINLSKSLGLTCHPETVARTMKRLGMRWERLKNGRVRWHKVG